MVAAGRICEASSVHPKPGPAPLPELLRRWRLDAGMTIRSLAERSAVSPRAIGDIERGVSTAPRRDTLLALASALDLDPADRDALLAAVRRRARRPTGTGRPMTIPPAPDPVFTGRDDELAGLAALLAAGPVPRTVVVSGPPGIGKTSVAVEAVRRTGRAAVAVDLDGHGADPLSAVEVLQAVLRQVLAVGEAIPESADALAALWRRIAAERRPLVVLDDAASEAQVRPVVAPSTRGHVVVTSRRVLGGLTGADHVVVGPLGVDESTRLLAKAIPVGRRDGADLAELARLCDHVPLALRIAAELVTTTDDRTARDVVTELRPPDRRLRVLVSGGRSVGAALDQSHRGLDGPTAALFHAVSVTDGDDFDAGVAAVVADVDVDFARDGLDALADVGLLEPLRGDRYRLHDLVALFALQRLRASSPAAEEEHRDRLRRAP